MKAISTNRLRTLSSRFQENRVTLIFAPEAAPVRRENVGCVRGRRAPGPGPFGPNRVGGCAPNALFTCSFRPKQLPASKDHRKDPFGVALLISSSPAWASAWAQDRRPRPRCFSSPNTARHQGHQGRSAQDAARASRGGDQCRPARPRRSGARRGTRAWPMASTCLADGSSPPGPPSPAPVLTVLTGLGPRMIRSSFPR